MTIPGSTTPATVLRNLLQPASRLDQAVQPIERIGNRFGAAAVIGRRHVRVAGDLVLLVLVVVAVEAQQLPVAAVGRIVVVVVVLVVDGQLPAAASPRTPRPQLAQRWGNSLSARSR